MQHFGEKTVRTCIAITCDRCKTRFDDSDFLEIQEFMSFTQSCGYGSVFGDLNVRSIDLCQSCQKEVLGQWMRVDETRLWNLEEPEGTVVSKFEW